MEKEQNNYMSEFERNVLKRAEIEKRKKKREEDKQFENELMMHEKLQKKQ